MSDQKLFCHTTMLNDVSVGNIGHSFLQSPQKSLIYMYILRYSLIFKFFLNFGCATF